MLIDIIAAEQTDFIKIASVIAAIQKEKDKGTGIRYRLIYTGRFSEIITNKAFFEQLGIPRPNLNLETPASVSDIEQTAIVMVRYEKVLSLGKPQLVLITGDSNATIACAITAKKTFNIPIGHIESGIRNRESISTTEINRVLSDSISDYYFTPSHSANENLRKTGVPDEKIFFVGNTRVDTLLKQRELQLKPEIWSKLKLSPKSYFLACLHKPRNMKLHVLKELLIKITKSANNLPVIFPIDEPNNKFFAAVGVKPPALYVVDKMAYPEFIFLLENARAVVTDYNGIQEETTVLHVPCMCIGNNKELPETFSAGTNFLISKPNDIISAFEKINEGKWRHGNIPYMWDGKSAERVLALIKNIKIEI